ncbi:hypothetical protein IAR55_000621 [Kwoniella newhampshirensis]|uniref:Peptidase C14 caspase domain-containing protein n=1 Tax=Kwoniella newhampshirensis TaxID=1651941 RepID=A0AAW0Z744_9TREE
MSDYDDQDNDRYQDSRDVYYSEREERQSSDLSDSPFRRPERSLDVDDYHEQDGPHFYDSDGATDSADCQVTRSSRLEEGYGRDDGRSFAPSNEISRDVYQGDNNFYASPADPPPGMEVSDGEQYYPPQGLPLNQYPESYPVHTELPTQQYQQTGARYVPQVQYQAPRSPYGRQSIRQNDGNPHRKHFGPQFTDPITGEAARAFFQYSRCNGRRKALLIGINYIGTANALNGCINDARNRDDALFFHYSGHGTQMEDVDGDEEDGYDEVAICPLDYQQAGLIIDDDSGHDLLVSPLPAGCRLTAIFDSCHSGSVMDLPYTYSTEGKIKEPDLLAEASQGLLGAGMDVLRGDTGGIMSNLFGAARSVWEAKEADQKTRGTKTSPADVISWSGCKDDQTSADTEEAGRATGAMSYAFIAALSKYPNQSYQQLLITIREEMIGRYTQKPQLSACHPIDIDLQFVA